MKNKNLFIILYITSFMLIISETTIGPCQNGIRRVEVDSIYGYYINCIYCDGNKITKFNNDDKTFYCEDCPKDTFTDGKNPTIKIFDRIHLTGYKIKSECESGYDFLDCKFKTKKFSVRANYIKNSKYRSKYMIEQYYSNDGELKIKYLNYNGGLDKKFEIYINDTNVYTDDIKTTKIKDITIKIKKGLNKFSFAYNVNNDLIDFEENNDQDSYLELYEFIFINSETSGLYCNRYAEYDKIKDSFLNYCSFDITKCDYKDLCTYRFYTESISDYCNVWSNSHDVTYKKIEASNCSQLIDPASYEKGCEHCTKGQFLNITDPIKKFCNYCTDNNYNNLDINDNENCTLCNESENKIYPKVYYIKNFENSANFSISLQKIYYTANININYEKFNEKEDTIIYISKDMKEYYNLINPDDDNIKSNFYNFVIPFTEPSLNLHIIGANLKLKKVEISGTNDGGNYNCLDRIEEKEMQTCNENEYYSFLEKKCIKCNLGTSTELTQNQCFLKQQMIINKFYLDNSLINQHIISNVKMNQNDNKTENKYYFDLNTMNPLIYKLNSDNIKNIIGKELRYLKVVKGIKERGIIFGYYNQNNENNNNFNTYIYIKCEQSELNYKIENIKEDIENNKYYFLIKTNYVCPYCLKNETEIEIEGKCIDYKKINKLKPKNESQCMIKSFIENNGSQIIDDINLLLDKNSEEESDKTLIKVFSIDENIPINYEQETDEIVTDFYETIDCDPRNYSSEYDYSIEPKSNEDSKNLKGGEIILIVLGSVLFIGLIILIIYLVKFRKNKKESLLKDESEEFEDNAKNNHYISNINNEFRPS